MVREKMSRQDRAKQFAPFDALKGLHDALKVVEYKQEMVTRGEMSEEDAKNISDVLISLEKSDIVHLTYFDDGHYKTYEGRIRLDMISRQIEISKDIKINLDSLQSINIIR